MANLTYRQSIQEAPSFTTTKNASLTSQEIDGNFKSLNDELITKAPLVSPGLSGVPTAPTATAGTNTTQLATTAFVQTGLSSRQPLDATLTALAGVTTAANRLIYATGADVFTTTSLTTFGRSIIDDADASTARSTLGLGSLATLSSINNSNWSGAALAVANGGTGVTTSTGTGSVVLSASPALTGTPTAPTATAGTNTTQLATTAFVIAERNTTATLSNKTITAEREVCIAGGTGGSFVIDLATGNYFTRTFNAGATITVTNVPASGTAQAFIFDITNAGSYTITWMTGIKWTEGATPLLTPSGRDVLGFFTHDGGTTWNGVLIAKDIK